MVTIKSLQAQIKKEESKIGKAKSIFEKQKKIKSLQIKLRSLKKTPSQIRNQEFIKRTGRGLKIIGKKIGSATIKQAKRIKAQQQRDLAKTSPSKSERVKIVTIIKRKGKKPLKTIKFKSKKIKLPKKESGGIMSGFGDFGF